MAGIYSELSAIGAFPRKLPPQPGANCLGCEALLQRVFKSLDHPLTASSLFCADCSAALRSDDKMYLMGWFGVVSPFNNNDAYQMGKEDRYGEQE